MAWVVGLYLLKMNTAELLGGVSGARCASSALRSAQEVCESTVPAVAYPVTYAVASLLLTLLTYVLALMEEKGRSPSFEDEAVLASRVAGSVRNLPG